MPKVTLHKPITRGEIQITEVELREPKAGELRGVRLNDLVNADVDAVITVLPRITSPSLQKHEVEQLGTIDISEFSGEIMGFFIPADQP